MRHVAAALVSLGMVAGAARAAGETCGIGDLEAICGELAVPLTAGPNPLDGPTIDSGITYAIGGYAPGRRSYVVFEPAVSGEYTVYTGGPPVAVQLREELPSCTSPAPKSCMHTVATYDLVAGERYELELGVIASGQRIRIRIEAPVDEPRVAIRIR